MSAYKNFVVVHGRRNGGGQGGGLPTPKIKSLKMVTYK